ncbi:MAG: DNA polymerase III subunit gamma/tau, partial [Betaproteobacteria bacterium]|nr:DNA polymerase III subunit gamma/tau [Betaproteobacteria bacterium]
IAVADRMASGNLSFEGALQDLGSLLHRIVLFQTVPGAVAEDDPDRDALEELARKLAPEELQLYYQITVQGRSDLGLAPDEYAGFTMTLLRMLAFAPVEQEAAAPRAARSAATPQRPAADPESKKNRGDAAWPELIEQLGLSGMARMLAQHCELIARDGARLELRISQAHQHLLDGPYQERLKAALEQHFGGPLRLAIGIADDAGSSPAALADREQQQKQAQAIATIEQDPFVRDLVENFDARVVESSIKPVP